MGMTLDQQLAEIISAAQRRIVEQASEQINGLVGQISHAAAADRTAAVREARLAADAEIAQRLQEAVAAAQADSARRTEDALAAAHADAERRVEAAAAEAQAEATRHRDDEMAAARQSELAQIDRVVEAVRRFDQADSLTDVLDALGEVTSREAPRVALFLVRNGRLAGWRATGFGAGTDPGTIDVGHDDGSLLWRAVASGVALSTTDAPAGVRWTTPFDQPGVEAAGFAVPVRVGGETVAVVYADDATDGPRAVPSAWPEVVEVLARYAARCLEVLTMSRTAPQTAAGPARPIAPRAHPPERLVPAPRAEDDESARRFARLLVSEIKLYHESAVTEGRHGHNLMERLGAEIERARKLYDDRVPDEIRSRVDHFGQELVRTLANGDPALLGATRP